MNWKVPKDMVDQEERIRELEQEVERLRNALQSVRRGLKHIAHRTTSTATREDAHQGTVEIADALNGEGDTDD